MSTFVVIRFILHKKLRMGKETSNRIQTSLLNAMEKKVLIWMAERQPLWMTSDMLTYIGLLLSLIHI